MDAESDPIRENVVCAHRTSRNDDNPFHRHSSGYEIYLFLQGRIDLYVEHSRYRLHRGDLLVLAPAEMHRAATLDDALYERLTVNIRSALVARLSTTHTDLSSCFLNRPEGEGNAVSLTDAQMAEFLELFWKIHHNIDRADYGCDIVAEAALLNLLLLVNQSFRSPASQPDDIMPSTVTDVMLYIDEHLAEPITLENLSSIFCRNGRAISREFKKHTGITLREYLLHKRIDRACSLLRQRKSVTEVCYGSGFGNYSNFIRTFTREIGVPPGRYARSPAG